MAILAVDESQRNAARVAGILYLFTILAANFVEFYLRRQIIVPGDALRTAANIAHHEQLFRLGITTDLLMLAANVVLVVALYVILKPVSRNLALLAVFWWLVECAIAAATSGTDFAAVLSLTGPNSLPALNTEQLQALARLLISLDGGGNRAAALFFRTGFNCLLLSVVQVTLYSAGAGRRRNPCFPGAHIHTFVHHCPRVSGRCTASACSNRNPDCYL